VRKSKLTHSFYQKVTQLLFKGVTQYCNALSITTVTMSAYQDQLNVGFYVM